MPSRIPVDDGLLKLTARVTPEAMRILKAECVRRRRIEAAVVPYGKFLSELLLEYEHSGRGARRRGRPRKERAQSLLYQAAG